jgi:protein toll
MSSVPLWGFVCDVSDMPACPRGCTCLKRPSNRTLLVSCPPRLLTELPQVLPVAEHLPPANALYELRFYGSLVSVIDSRPYFHNTTLLDVSRSAVVNVTDDAWRTLVSLSFVDLSFNQLTVLPRILQSENLTFRSLALHNNPWRCDCTDRWIRTWMESLGNRLVYPDAVKCQSPDWQADRSILSVSDEEFCRNPERQRIKDILKVNYCL